MKPTFWASLPSEYQMVLIVCLLGLMAWFGQLFSATLTASVGAVLTFLSSLALGIVAHGASARWKSGNADKDLIGDINDGTDNTH
jgi:uncharacterized membrane protein YjjB (DUF3815 family)